MLLDTATTTVTTSGHLETARATIKASPKVFSFFEKNTYGNAKRAIVREYVANGLDAHGLVGKEDVPMLVTLPTEQDPTIRFRDYGPGMSHEYMMTSFMAYTDGSTKSLDNKARGGFGIGSKSGFAYTDQIAFKVTSQGTVRIYTMFKDEDGCPSISLLHRRHTRDDDVDGVEVSFAVEPQDSKDFHTAAAESLAYFNPRPILVNATVDYFDPDYAATGEGWAMRRKAGPLGVIMGGIRYPVDNSSVMSAFPYSGQARNLLNYGLDITLPIGSCSIALSREALLYDTDTIRAVANAVSGVTTEVAARMATMFDQHPTKWAAMKALTAEIAVAGQRGTFLAANAKYMGQPLTTSFNISGSGSWIIAKTGSNAGSDPRRPRWTEWGGCSITPAETSAVFIWDLDPSLAPSKARGAARIDKAIFDNRISRLDNIVVIRSRSQSVIAEIMERLVGCPRVYRVSELEVPARAPAVRGERFKRPTQVWKVLSSYGFKNSRVDPQGAGTTGYELDGDDLADGGLIVSMTNFTVDDSSLIYKVQCGLIPTSDIVFVNKTDEAKLDKEVWLPFGPEFDKRLAAKLVEDPALPARLALSSSRLSPIFAKIKAWDIQPLTGSKASSPLGKIVALYNRYIVPVTGADHKLAPLVTAAFPPRVDPIALLDAFNAEQPLVARFIFGWTGGIDDTAKGILSKVL